MSYSFDVIQRALGYLEEADNLTEQQKQLIFFIGLFIDALHSESHRQKDKLNRGEIAEAAQDVDTVLKNML